MKGYYLSRQPKTGEIVYVNYDKYNNGYNITPKNTVKYDGIRVNKMIIVGGKNSSNTKELYNLALDNCKKSLLIQDVNDLNDVTIDEENIGIMAGASTPSIVVQEIIDYLKG